VNNASRDAPPICSRHHTTEMLFVAVDRQNRHSGPRHFEKIGEVCRECGYVQLNDVNSEYFQKLGGIFADWPFGKIGLFDVRKTVESEQSVRCS